MRTITKKIEHQSFEDILSGRKTFELRLANFEVEHGDKLVLQEHDENNQLTGREIIKTVGTVAKTKEQIFWDEEEMDRVGFLVLSLLDES